MRVRARTTKDTIATWRDAEYLLDIDVLVVQVLYAHITDESWDHYVEIDLVFYPQLGRYVVSRVSVGSGAIANEVFPTRTQQFREINSVLLREVRVTEMARLAASAGLFIRLEGRDTPASFQELFGPEGEIRYTGDLAATVREKVNAGDLRAVAQSYQIAKISGQPPAKAIERQFSVPARTASNWISKAKLAGLLEIPKAVFIPAYQRRGDPDGEHPEAS